VFAVLLPVKEFSRSKQRLNGWLTATEREWLARVMFEDVWQTLRSGCREYPLFVTSSEPFVIKRCDAENIPCLVEADQRSHSDSVRDATCWAMRSGVTALLSVPIDTPAVTLTEVATLATLARQHDVVVVPSADGTGTNALLRTPPDAIAPRFGPGSCAIHIEEALAAGLTHLVFPIPGFAADVDTPEDVERFFALNHSCRTTEFLRECQQTRRGAALCSSRTLDQARLSVG
jgi:2-phospho-L-lactate guanylyltransferase